MKRDSNPMTTEVLVIISVSSSASMSLMDIIVVVGEKEDSGQSERSDW